MSFKRFYLKTAIHIALLSGLIFLSIWAFYTDYLKFSKIGFSIAVLIEIYLFFMFLKSIVSKISEHLKIIPIDESLPRIKNKYIDNGFVEIEKELANISESYHKIKIQNEKEQAFLKSLLEQVDTGLFAFNEKGEVYIANRAVARLLKRQRLENIKDFSSLNEELPALLKLLVPGESKLIKLAIDAKSIKYVFTAHQIKLNNKRLKTVFIYDMSQELDREELENWQKLLKTIRHEIINSITPIATMSETMLEVIREGKLNELKGTGFEKDYKQLEKCIESINNRCSNLELFVKAYKEYSTLPNPAIKEFDLTGLITSLQVLLSPDLNEKGIEFKVKFTEDILLIKTDESILSQVIVNLIKNAEEAIGENGEVTIILSKKNNKILISVQDSATGIPPELKDKIFIPFFSTKDTGQGIGLSFSRQLMHKLGGKLILAESSEKGTRMEIEL